MLALVCISETAAALTLGYMQLSWDDETGKEQQPWSIIKPWVSLTGNEKEAAVVLGYTSRSWDNDSGLEPQPASAFKTWAELTACPDGENAYLHPPGFVPLRFSSLIGG